MSETAETKTPFAGWAILELMGHRRLGGLVREVELAGAGMLRIDIPGEDAAAPPLATQFYSPSALYCLTPCSEAAARAVARSNRPEPVHRWELPAPQPASGGFNLCPTCGNAAGACDCEVDE